MPESWNGGHVSNKPQLLNAFFQLLVPDMFKNAERKMKPKELHQQTTFNPTPIQQIVVLPDIF